MYCIAEFTFIFDEFNKASDNILRFPRIPVQSTAVCTLDKKDGLPVHRFYHAALAPNRRNGAKPALGLRYGDRRFLPNVNCGEKHLQSGAKGEGRSGFRKQDFFFFFCLREHNHNKYITSPEYSHPNKY